MACSVVAMTRVMPNGFSGPSPMVSTIGGAIRIGDDLALPAAVALLARHQLQVVGIDFGHQQRHVRAPCDGSWNWTPPRGRPARRRARFRWPRRHPWRRRAGAARCRVWILRPADRRRNPACAAQSCQVVASRYGLPAERSLAPSHFRSNHGWFCRNLTKCWPTMPVAPRMPTSILVCISLSRLDLDCGS